MMWIAWRQHRAECLFTLGALAVLAVFLIITGLDMANAFQQLGLSTCLLDSQRDCHDLENAFQNQIGLLPGVDAKYYPAPLAGGKTQSSALSTFKGRC
jgi:hypothetical protein